MTLSDFATISTAVSGVAVTVSLIYLAIQTRQNSRHTRALIQQGASARTTAITLAHQSPESCAAWIEGNGGTATPEGIRRLQFNLMCATGITALEDLYGQRNDRLLSAEQFARNCDTHRGLLAQPGFRAYWVGAREDVARVAPKFCEFVDGLIVGEAEFNYRV